MYSWLWRKLPGNRFIKLLQATLLLAGALAAMYFFIFPWLDAQLFLETDTDI